jgi:hypothetical protein
MRPRLMARTLLIAGAVVPAAAFGVLYRWSSGFRKLVRGTDSRDLTMLQASRVVGAAMFARAYSAGRIPAYYGVTVAMCDLAAGITAPIAARWMPSRAMASWNRFGLAAILVSGGSGVLASSIGSRFDRRRASRSTTSLPLVLVPTLFGPITLVAHLMVLTAIREGARLE